MAPRGIYGPETERPEQIFEGHDRDGYSGCGSKAPRDTALAGDD